MARLDPITTPNGKIMTIWGKILGGVAGFALGGPIGALVGAIAGHAVDAMRADHERAAGPDSAGATEAGRQAAFTVALVVLGAQLARADGTITRREVDTFKRVFRISPEDMGTVGLLFDQVRQDTVGFKPYAKQAASLFADRPAVLEALLEGLFAMAYADGQLHPAELAYLREVADILGVTDAAFARVHARHRPAADPYDVLGVARDADDMVVHLAHRRLIQDFNPERLTALGLPREFAQVAHDKAAAIEAAYDQVRRRRGIAER